MGYDKSGRYGPVVVTWGGEAQRGTVYVSIPGTISGALTAHKLAQISVFLEKTGARLTRLDCAVDDYDGRFLTIERVREWYAEGRFISNGRPPKATHTNLNRQLFYRICTIKSTCFDLGIDFFLASIVGSFLDTFICD